MGRVVVAGSINADIVVRAARLPQPGETVSGHGVAWHAGGKGANQAAAAGSAGAEVTFIGCVGDDDHGGRLVDVLAGFGVEVVARRVPGASGQASIWVDAHGENSIVVVAGANAALGVDDVTGLGLAAGDVAVAVLESPVDAVVAFLRDAAPATRVLTPAPLDACTPEVLAHADVVVVNEHEAAEIGPVDATLVVTLGAGGVRIGDTTIPGISVAEVVDTTGAGDCFAGTLAARLAAGDALTTAAAVANAAAARSVTRPGAMESYRD